jgi:hypothetical protein
MATQDSHLARRKDPTLPSIPINPDPKILGIYNLENLNQSSELAKSFSAHLKNTNLFESPHLT